LSGLVNKIKSIMGIVSGFEGDEEEIFDELYGAEEDYQVQNNLALDTSRQSSRRSDLKVVSHPSVRSGYEVKVIEPRSFEESLEIVNNLREGRSVILNLHLLDAEQSQRIVDFLSGATHAIDGHQQKIGDGVFIFTPRNVAISSETERTRIISEALWNQPK